MKKSIARVAVVLAASLAAARAQQTTAADPVARAHQDIASLIPADAAAVARLTSIDELLQYANELATAAGKETKLTADRLLAQLGPIPGKRELIDLHLPIVLAVSLPRATPPEPVMLLPMTDPAAYCASVAELGMSPAVAGSYVAVPLAGKYEKPAAPSALLNELPDGTFAVYADVEKLVAAFGTVIGASLSAAKVGIAQQLERSSPGIDGEALAELYVDGARTVLGCGKALRFCVGYRAGTIDLFATLQVKPDSDMDGWSSTPLDATALGGRPAGNGVVEMLVAADWRKVWPRFTLLIDRIADVYPKATADVLRKATADYAPLYAVLGPVIALDGDVLAADGVNMAMTFAASDAAVLRKEVDALFGKDWFADVGITIAAPRTTESGGATIADRELAIDFAKFAGAVDLTLTGMGGITGEQLLQAVFGGSRIPLRIATKNERGVLVIGKQDAAMTTALDGAARPWSKPVQAALARVADCNPLVVERIDAVALIAGFVRTVRQLDDTLPAPEYPADATGNVVLSAGIHGSEWRAGMSVDFAGFAKAVRSQTPR